MKNLTNLTLTTVLFTALFIFVETSKTQACTLEAEILFIAISLAAYLVMSRNKKNLQPIPVKVKAHRKY